MNITPQFIAVKFREGDAKTYTYMNNGPNLRVGDIIKVPDRSGEGWMRGIVVADVPQPTFKCKAVIGKIEG